MANAKLDYAIATEICGYPKDNWRVMISTVDGVEECILYKPEASGGAPCTRKRKVFSPTSDWALAGKLLEEHGVNLQALLLDNLPGLVK